MNKRPLFILVLAGLLTGGLFAWKFYQMQQAVRSVHAPPPAVVAVTEVRQAAWQASLSAVGSLVAVAGVQVSNEIAGIVKAIHFHSGEKVKKGQLLVELDTETDQSELAGLLAQQRLAQIRFQRSSKLIGGKFVSKSVYDQNQALLDEAKAAVLTKKTVIEKKHIRAPFSGELGIRKINLGQYLPPGSVIVPLQKTAPVYVDFTLPERHLKLLAPGQEVSVNVQAYPDRVFKGRISAISPLLDRQTRSIPIRAILANSDRLLRANMFARVQVLSGQTRQLLTLPDTAISYNPYGDFVFVIESGSHGLTVQSRQVQTGATRNGRVEIVKGLSRGERVVSAGQVKLRNGMPVTIDTRPAPGERTKDAAP